MLAAQLDSANSHMHALQHHFILKLMPWNSGGSGLLSFVKQAEDIKVKTSQILC